MTNDAVQSLWIGPRLGTMERTAIGSFLRQGHAFELYTYGAVDGIPSGAHVRDANEILLADRIFTYRHGFGAESYAGFSNFFRYKLLLERGGWWVDTDVVCLRRFDFTSAHVFAAEVLDAEGHTGIASAVIKAPAGSDAMRFAWDTCRTKDVTRIAFNETGPHLIGEAVERYGLGDHVQPPATFCPVHWFEWRRITDVSGVTLPDDAYAVHLWNEMWRHHAADKDAAYPGTSLYETLKKLAL